LQAFVEAPLTDSTFVGSDYHDGSIETARKRAEEASVTDRVRFEHSPAASYPGKGSTS
jgi:ubiquinone/menaquinone biosynthesis C-methylase UbiE